MCVFEHPGGRRACRLVVPGSGTGGARAGLTLTHTPQILVDGDLAFMSKGKNLPSLVWIDKVSEPQDYRNFGVIPMHGGVS